ncbi:hypothetical protein [Lysobacter sp. CA199]|uniref:hypothetical protein n=1 Tax=Lysobacter sp. CA199 TaxID=3455608 RepID=UPI003F8D27B8
MKKLARCMIALSALVLCAEASAQAKQEPKISCPIDKALSGEALAAKLCADESLKIDQSMHRYWTQIAAENGDALCQYNLALILLGKKRQHDRVRAVFWLKKSAQSGFALAKDVLEQLEKNPSITIPVAPPPSN